MLKKSDKETSFAGYSVEVLSKNGEASLKAGPYSISVSCDGKVNVKCCSTRGFIKKREVKWEAVYNNEGFLFKVDRGEKHPFAVQVNTKEGGIYFSIAPHSESWYFSGMMSPGGYNDDFLSLAGVKHANNLFQKRELINSERWGAVRLEKIEEISHHDKEIEEAAKLAEHAKRLLLHPEIKKWLKEHLHKRIKEDLTSRKQD